MVEKGVPRAESPHPSIVPTLPGRVSSECIPVAGDDRVSDRDDSLVKWNWRAGEDVGACVLVSSGCLAGRV